jgi:hypothetical protein
MSDIVLADEKNKLTTALQGWASALARLTPEQVPAALDMASQFKKLGTEVYDRLRDRVLERVKANGQIVGEKGSMQDSVGGFKLSAIPTKSGTDPKKLEAKLRALGKDPANYMDATVTYKVNEGKLNLLLQTGTLTKEDVAYDPAYRVSVERE